MKIHFLILQIGAALLLLSACSSAPEKSSETNPAVQQEDPTELIEQASLLIQQTFDTLSQSLMSAIQSEGPVYAIEFCNEQALNLTQSLTNTNWSISRQSYQNRNPLNQPNEYAAQALDSFQKMEFPQNRDQWIIIHTANDSRFYKPIVLMPHCMMCHGDPNQDISKPVLAAIQERYPHDKATGYIPHQLRGVWEVIKTNAQ